MGLHGHALHLHRAVPQREEVLLRVQSLREVPGFRPTLLFTDHKKKQKHKKEKNISLRGWESIGIHDVCSELSGMDR